MTMWYIHAVNKITNGEVTRRLSERGDGSADSFVIGQQAEDGKPYDVIELDFRLLREMYGEANGMSTGEFVFLPFKRERSDETLKFVPEFLLQKSKSKKVRAAIEFIRRKQAEKAAT